MYAKTYAALSALVAQFVVVAGDGAITLTEAGTLAVAALAVAAVFLVPNRSDPA